ncbi:homeodomain mating type protein alpha2 NDAI_0A00110 [Naumovozyma dairenensis CBS 421]|uniref:Homeobox domain-containing protein n=1 Tax=Naumovozyma dairenensis (strain ATCC 10597 / BCRC 20456 / CBS 421 / NBRC 0211 / NRRL Y-12639) TaxID=1071378 RepID=G0W5F7_NAUDC|nr:hypothetical protein NDAI_0A00110 [Naumovozyma dairenensis CBS 421]CCD22171.1 hypothetical protein NDAI_0A00110 [Naumovozyma dairenensis CBS 421]
MNKIAISDLLNPPTAGPVTSNLDSINNQLVTICSKFPTAKENVDGSYQIQLHNIVSFLSTLTQSTNLTSKDCSNIQLTYELSSMLGKVLKDMVLLNGTEEVEKKKVKEEEELETNSKYVFNVITQDMMIPEKNKPHRGHRLPKEKVNRLEHWYLAHIQKPYLDSKNLKVLMEETKLSKVQIKNWISNRRRKEKLLSISPDIVEIINTQSCQ